MARGCARLSQAHNSWNWKGSFPRTCTYQDSEESKSPRIWTCQRNRWKSGFRTAGWSTRRKGKPPKGAHTAVASAQPVTQTIQGQRTRSLYLRPLLRKTKRCQPFESNMTPNFHCWHLLCPSVMGHGITKPLGLHEVWEEMSVALLFMFILPLN